MTQLERDRAYREALGLPFIGPLPASLGHVYSNSTLRFRRAYNGLVIR